LSISRLAHQSRSGRSSSWIRATSRVRIYARDGWRCVWCQRHASTLSEPLTLDHFLPRALGGGNEPGNLLTCCYRCNATRQHKPALSYALDKMGLLFDGGPAALDRCLDALSAPLPSHLP
jgi:5-methylcytosine-specific restriction endonuclease McrA